MQAPETYTWKSGDDATLPYLGLAILGAFAYFCSALSASEATTTKDWIYLALFGLIFVPMGIWSLAYRETHTADSRPRQIVRTRSFLGIPLRRRYWDFAELSRVELGLGVGVKGGRHWSLRITMRSTSSGGFLVRTYPVGAAGASSDGHALAQVLGLPFVERTR